MKQVKVTKQDELMEKLGYSKKGIQYYNEKKNLATMKCPTVKGEQLGRCADYVSVSLKVNDRGIITDAVFDALGCVGAFVAGSTITDLVKGKTLNEASGLKVDDIVRELENFPKEKIPSIKVALKALKNAIKKYEK